MQTFSKELLLVTVWSKHFFEQPCCLLTATASVLLYYWKIELNIFFLLFTSFKSLVETLTHSQKILNNKNTVRHKHSNITDTVHTVIIGKKFLHPFKKIKKKKKKSLSGITYPKNPCRELVKFWNGTLKKLFYHPI